MLNLFNKVLSFFGYTQARKEPLWYTCGCGHSISYKNEGTHNMICEG